MRIVIASQTYYPGSNGQAIFTIHLAEGLARAGHEVHVILPSKSFQPGEDVVQNVRLHMLRSLELRWLHSDVYVPFLTGSHIRSILENCSPDVVHIQDHYFICRSVARTAIKMGLPVLGTNHFLPENVLPYLNLLPLPRNLKVSIMWDLMLWTYNCLEMVTTPTETAARILRSRNLRVPVQPVSCGVDTAYFKPNPDLDRAASCAQFGLDPQKVLFLYVGRLDREKRVDLLLRGLARVRAGGQTGVQLAIAGQGSAQAELRALARSLGLGDSARFLGYVPEGQLCQLYQTADIFAMPSPEELQSIATLEAMASGKPVLAANARALPELVSSGINGLLFEPGRVEAVAQGMQTLAAARADWFRMGRASRSRAVAHSLEATIRRYEEIYHRLGGIRHHPASDSHGVRFSRVKID